MKQNYAGPLFTKGSATNSLTEGKAFKQTASGDPLTNKKSQVQTGELIDKRTATSASFRNADGKITQKDYFQPINYQKNGQWQKIDTSLVQDSNADDSNNGTNPVRTVPGSTWSSPLNNYIVKDNSWLARFSPSNSPKGMIRIKQGTNQIGFVPINANQVNPSVTVDSKGTQTVHYYNLWNGVDVGYTVYSAQVKEVISLKDKNAINQLNFQVLGATLTKQVDGDFTINGLDGTFSVAPINLILNNFGYVAPNANYSQTYQNGVLTISVNGNYLKSLPSSSFPVAIDPGIDTVHGSDSSANYQNVKSDGTICGRNLCDMYTGGLYDSNNIGREWHNYFYAPYNRYQNTSYRLVVAVLYFTMSTGNYFTGTTANHSVYATRSICNNAFACNDPNMSWFSGTVGSTGQIDLTQLYLNRIANNDWGMWLALSGENQGNFNDFKDYDPNNTYMSFTWGDAPAAPPIINPGAFGQVFTDPQVSFKLGAVANPNNNVPLQYEIQVSSGPNGTGTLIDSGNLSTTQWTIPDGILQDGSTYYIRARSYDSTGSGYGNWSVSVNFKIDMRTGKDQTQTYDNLGPITADFATGNVSTSISSHTTKALAGDLGVSLDYNSPQKSRVGLSAQYWNNTSMSGSPAVSRVDQNINFDWGGGSYSAVY